MTYFDSARPGEQPSDSRRLRLDRKELEILFQVAHQLTNYDESRLIVLGCPSSELDELIDVLSSLRCRFPEGSARQVPVDDPQSRGEPLDLAHAVPIEIGDGGAEGIRSELPRVAARLPELTRFAISSIGAREMFLRTGFHIAELEYLIAKIEQWLDR